MEAWWEKAENGMNHTVKIGSLRMSILVVDFGSGRFCYTCSAERNGRFLRRSNWSWRQRRITRHNHPKE